MVVCFPIVRKENFETMTLVSGDRYSILIHFMFDYYSGLQISKRENESCYLEKNESQRKGHINNYLSSSSSHR